MTRGLTARENDTPNFGGTRGSRLITLPKLRLKRNTWRERGVSLMLGCPLGNNTPNYGEKKSFYMPGKDDVFNPWD